MDLGAYAQIEDLEPIATDNGIHVPRLRGYRLMAEEKPINIEEAVKNNTMSEVEMFFERCNWWHDNVYEYSNRITKRKKKYLVVRKDEDIAVDIRWDRIHGKLRKGLKLFLKDLRKRYEANYRVWNKYCGRKDILYIHARIGGLNWNDFGGPELAKQPWFIEKVDDAFDCTYCDIYAKIKPISL